MGLPFFLFPFLVYVLQLNNIDNVYSVDTVMKWANNDPFSFLQPRLRCLAHIVRKLDDPVQFIQAIIPEVSHDQKTLL